MSGAKILPWLGALTGAVVGGALGSNAPNAWLVGILLGVPGAVLGFMHGSVVRDDVLAEEARWAAFEKYLNTIKDPKKRFDEIMRYKVRR